MLLRGPTFLKAPTLSSHDRTAVDSHGPTLLESMAVDSHDRTAVDSHGPTLMESMAVDSHDRMPLRGPTRLPVERLARLAAPGGAPARLPGRLARGLAPIGLASSWLSTPASTTRLFSKPP